MIKKLPTLTAILFLVMSSHAQTLVSQYTFSMSNGTYTDIGSTGTYIGTGDQVAFGSLPIGFTFTFHCVDFTTFGVTSNGFLRLGATPPSGSNSVNYAFAAGTAASDSNTIGGLAADLYPMYSGLGKMFYETTGSPGSRVLTVEWQKMYFWGASADYSDDANFQIKLYEGTNEIRIVYGPAFESGHYDRFAQVGIRGVQNTDYNIIDDSGNTLQWNAVTNTTTGGNTLKKIWGISNTNEPGLGLTYIWTPPTTGCTPTGIKNSTVNINVSVYPDPTNGILFIQVNDLIGTASAQLFNTLGENILETSITSSKTEIDLSEIPNGIYFIMVSTENGSVTKKIVKE